MLGAIIILPDMCREKHYAHLGRMQHRWLLSRNMGEGESGVEPPPFTVKINEFGVVLFFSLPLVFDPLTGLCFLLSATEGNRHFLILT